MKRIDNRIEVLKRFFGIGKSAWRLLVRIHCDMWYPYDGSNRSGLKWFILTLMTLNMALYSVTQTWYWPTAQIRQDALLANIDTIISRLYLVERPQLMVGGTPVFTSVSVMVIFKKDVNIDKNLEQAFLESGWYFVERKQNTSSYGGYKNDIYYSHNNYYGSIFKCEVVRRETGKYILRFSEYNEIVDRAHKLDYARWK